MAEWKLSCSDCRKRDQRIAALEAENADLRTRLASAREDTERLDEQERNEWHLHSWREKIGDGAWSIWYGVTKRGKSISGHPQPSIRAAIDAARKAVKNA